MKKTRSRYWNGTAEGQQQAIDWLAGKSQVVMHGPNVDLTLSIKGRKFINSTGTHNMPDGEIFTGPVEDFGEWLGEVHLSGHLRRRRRRRRRIDLCPRARGTGQAEKNQAYLIKMLESDAGSRFLGEYAIGTNFDIDRFTGNILFDEKIGGTFHMALGAGYPETGSHNKSAIHWDMICDLRTDSEIVVDGELFYKNGQFVFEGK